MDDFYTLLGRLLLQAVYSGTDADGSRRSGPPDKGADGTRRFPVPEAATRDIANYSQLSPLFPFFNKSFYDLADDDSRSLMAILVAYKILGPERVVLPLTRAQYEQGKRELAPLMVKAHTYDVNFQNITLDLYDLAQTGANIKVHSTRSALLAHFFLKQYELRRGNALITVEPGDTVIEGGMCYGDTALLFAHMAGEAGRVIGYEFEPNNLKVLKENLYLNPDLAKRIKVMRNAVLDVSGQDLSFAMAGPATFMLAPGQKVGREVIKVKTLTIDDLVERERLERVDFIKLDVEGAEFPTLVGSAGTLRRFKPKLALSAYHKHDDIPKLMQYVQSLDLGYRFWIDHFRPHEQETVLFAKCDAR